MIGLRFDYSKRHASPKSAVQDRPDLSVTPAKAGVQVIDSTGFQPSPE
jgi:hypothetical protein